MQNDQLLNRRIDLIGGVSLVAAVAQLVLSYFLGASQPPLRGGEHQINFFSRLIDDTGFFSPAIRRSVFGDGIFTRGYVFLIAYCGPLVITTLCFVAVLALVIRARRELQDTTADRLCYWGIAFAIAVMLAYNVLTQDIWLSVVWGRMTNVGMNPFTIPFPTTLTGDLPLDYDQIRATYGPFWLLISATITAVTFNQPLLSWVLLKLVLLVSWIGCLWLISDMTKSQGAYRRALAITILGWLPLSVHSSVAEGHNDVVMIFFALLWLRNIRSKSPMAPLMLMVSILTKYVTAPLIFVDILFHWRSKTTTFREYVLRATPAIVVGVGVCLILVRLGGFGHQTAEMARWRFLDPAGVLRALAYLTGHTLSIGMETFELLPFLAAFCAIALVQCLSLTKHPSIENVYRTGLAILSSMMFVVVGHVWPWFFIWCIPLAALAPSYWLSRFVIGAATVAPFTIAHWWRYAVDPHLYPYEVMALPMYSVAAIGAFVTRSKSKMHD